MKERKKNIGSKKVSKSLLIALSLFLDTNEIYRHTLFGENETQSGQWSLLWIYHLFEKIIFMVSIEIIVLMY